MSDQKEQQPTAAELYAEHRKSGGLGTPRADRWKATEPTESAAESEEKLTPKEVYQRHHQTLGLGNPNLWKH